MTGYDIYDCFTTEHFRLHQRMTLTTKIFCSRLYLCNVADCIFQVNCGGGGFIILRKIIQSNAKRLGCQCHFFTNFEILNFKSVLTFTLFI
jgi:hypothetical protein